MTEYTNVDVDTVARTLWGEARSEGRAGMEAVANVIMNRAAKPGWWGRDPASCCIRRSQFSCWNLGDPNRAKMMMVDHNNREFVVALEIAQMALAGLLRDATKGADSYVNHGIAHPAWATPEKWTVRIGRHDFYRVAK